MNPGADPTRQGRPLPRRIPRFAGAAEVRPATAWLNMPREGHPPFTRPCPMPRHAPRAQQLTNPRLGNPEAFRRLFHRHQTHVLLPDIQICYGRVYRKSFRAARRMEIGFGVEYSCLTMRLSPGVTRDPDGRIGRGGQPTHPPAKRKRNGTGLRRPKNRAACRFAVALRAIDVPFALGRENRPQLTNRPKNGAHGAQGRKRGPEGGDANAPSKTPAWAGPRLPCPLSPR